MAAKRPLMPREDRDRLKALSIKAARHREETGTNQAYAQAVIDVLNWLVGTDNRMAPMFEHVTR